MISRFLGGSVLTVILLVVLVPQAHSQTITVQQSSTTRKLTFLMIDSTDHLSGKTGLTPTVTLSKNGGTFAAPMGTVTAIGNGWYALTPASGDTDTLGSLVLHATATGADVTDKEFNIIAVDPNATKVPATVAANDSVDAATLVGRLTSTRASNLDFLDAAVSAIKAQTDQMAFTGGRINALALLDLTQALSLSQTGDTVGGALLAARAQGFGKWVITGTVGTAGATLKLYAADGVTILRTFDMSSAKSRL
jgi:hypothetical protein